MADKDKLDDARESFKRKLDAESEQRKASQDDLEFALLDRQWPEDVQSARQRESRPCLTINRLPSFLKQVTNDARQNRPAMTARPVGSGASIETAKIIQDLFRNIETQSAADIVYDTAMDFAAACGVGYFRVNVDYTCDDEWDQDIALERISNPFTVYGDEASKEATSIDWNDAFVTEWITQERFKAKWKGAKAASFNLEDQKDEHWFDDKRIRVAERWMRDEVPTELLKLSNGQVMTADAFEKVQELLVVQGVSVTGTRPSKTYRVRQILMTGTDVLEENDWLGKYIPIVPMYGEEVNVNGKRYFISLIRRAKDPQRMFNYWRTAATELVALAPKAPFVGAVGQFATDPNWGTANSVSHPYLEYDPVPNAPPPQRQPFAGVPAGALQEALNASDDMKAIMGIYDASLGARSNETSGRAIMARQREGDNSTFNFIDNRNRAVEHGGRIVLDLIPKVYTVPRIMRCIKEDGSAYNVPVNQPVQVIQDQPGQEEYQPAPEHIEGVTRVFDLTTGKYDVKVTAGPSYTTRRQETAEQMMEFIRVFPQSAPIIGDLLAKNLDWPGADQVAERLKAMLPPQAHGQIPPFVQKLQAMVQELQKKVDDKAGEERVKAFQADSDRIRALAEAYSKGLLVTQEADGSITGQPLAVNGAMGSMQGMGPPGMMNQPQQNPGQPGFPASGAQ